jgi:hypothetical protein
MITAAIAVTILVALTILVHYEVLRVASVLIPERRHVRPRFRVENRGFACFAAHTIEVAWLFRARGAGRALRWISFWSASFTYRGDGEVLAHAWRPEMAARAPHRKWPPAFRRERAKTVVNQAYQTAARAAGRGFCTLRERSMVATDRYN